MLELMRDRCEKRKIGYAWHTGSVPQQRRRTEINSFKSDPDLLWNPAKLGQRIARAWRKHQTRPVAVINLVSENTIEHRMLETLALKQSVAASVLDRPGEVKEIRLSSGRQAMAERLQQLITPTGNSLNANHQVKVPWRINWRAVVPAV